MLPDSHLPSHHGFSPSRPVDVLRGESEADAVTMHAPEDGTILSLVTAQDSVSSSSDGNASSSFVLESGKKPVWGRISNGASDTGPVVMGGSVSWPALTESAKTSNKTSSEGFTSALGHMNSPPAQRKFAKRGSEDDNGNGVGTSGSFSSNGGSSSSSSLASSNEISQNTTGQPGRGSYNNRDRGSRESQGWVDHGNRQKRLGGSNRRGNNGNRRDQEGGVREWNSSRFSSGRDIHMQRGLPRLPAMRPPMPAMVPFIGSLPVQPYPVPMIFSDFPYQGYYFPAYHYPEDIGGNSFVPRATIPPPIQPPIFFASPYDQQRTSLLNQIDYYFSMDNLCKDVYLRTNMDEHGWVSIYVIADFKRVKLITDDVQFILDVLRSSDVVEVQGHKIRRRHGWSDWILNSKQNQHKTEPGSLYRETTDQRSLVSHVETLAICEGNVESNGEN